MARVAPQIPTEGLIVALQTLSVLRGSDLWHRLLCGQEMKENGRRELWPTFKHIPQSLRPRQIATVEAAAWHGSVIGAEWRVPAWS